MNDNHKSRDKTVTSIAHYYDLLELFDKISFRKKVQKFFYGLSQAHDTGDYKWAKLQMVRMLAPLSAVIIPILLFTFLMACATVEKDKKDKFVIRIQDDNPVEVKLDEKPDFKKDVIEPPKIMENYFAAGESVVDDQSTLLPADSISPVTVVDNIVILSKSPVTLRGFMSNRNQAARKKALLLYDGNDRTEEAVMRALRWLKKNQREDGSWGKSKPSMTGLALLTFLAHGETPGEEEFGATVEKAIKYLVANKDSTGGWNRRYEHAICTYALCEAYAMTKIPMLKAVCITAVDIIIQGQNPTGGWRYGFKPPDEDDTSVMGWCAQALKAAKMAEMPHPQLDDAIKLTVMAFQKNADPRGGFGYTGPAQSGLSGVGVLCMQLLGASSKIECKKGLEFLDSWTYSWKEPQGASPIYYWYYITQAKFHAGGKRWDQWNAFFWNVLVENQQVEEDAITDSEGELQNIGYWVSPGKKEHNGGNGAVMDTCLSTLQLEVYYRNLPTFKKYAVVDKNDDIDFAQKEEDLSIEIDI